MPVRIGGIPDELVKKPAPIIQSNNKILDSRNPKYDKFFSQDQGFNKDNFYIHTETKNTTFLKMVKILRNRPDPLLKRDEDLFFLALYDTTLKHVDPHDPNLPLDLQIRVLAECKVNFWYFARECVRIKVPGSRTGVRYRLDRGNLALNWCALHNFSFYTEYPRQTGKTIGICTLLLWLYGFATEYSDMMFMHKQGPQAIANLTSLKDIKDLLPQYMQFNWKFNDKGIKLIHMDKAESITHPKLHNNIITKNNPRNELSADRLGRGFTQIVQWFDEFAHMEFNSVVRNAAAPAFAEAARTAIANGKYAFRAFSATPATLVKKDIWGQEAYKMIHACVPFKEFLYDREIEEPGYAQNYLSNNGIYDIFFIKFSYKELGRSEAYYNDQVKQLGLDWGMIRKDVLLHWEGLDDDSPFDVEDMRILDDMSKSGKEYPYRHTINLLRYYDIEMYERIDPRIRYIIAVDVSTGVGKDNSAISIINPSNKRQVGTFKSSKIDTVALSNLLIELVTYHIQNSLVIVESNGIGYSVVTNLIHSSIRENLFFEEVNDETKERTYNGFSDRTRSGTRRYGLYHSNTGKNTTERQYMFEKLAHFVKYFPERIAHPEMYEELSNLVFVNGRVDHAPGFHDDLVMSYNIGIYAYYYKNLSNFGIVRIPDPDKTDEQSLSEKEAYLEQIRMINDSVDKSLYTNQGELYDDESMFINTNVNTKSAQDWYDQIDKERDAFYNEKNGVYTNVEFDDSLYTNQTEGGEFDIRDYIPY